MHCPFIRNFQNKNCISVMAVISDWWGGEAPECLVHVRHVLSVPKEEPPPQACCPLNDVFEGMSVERGPEVFPQILISLPANEDNTLNGVVETGRGLHKILSSGEATFVLKRELQADCILVVSARLEVQVFKFDVRHGLSC